MTNLRNTKTPTPRERKGTRAPRKESDATRFKRINRCVLTCAMRNALRDGDEALGAALQAFEARVTTDHPHQFKDDLCDLQRAYKAFRGTKLGLGLPDNAPPLQPMPGEPLGTIYFKDTT